MIRIEAEALVTILPERGVIINSLSHNKDFQHISEMLGGLESKIIMLVFHKIGAREIARFKRLNKRMIALAEKKVRILKTT